MADASPREAFVSFSGMIHLNGSESLIEKVPLCG
jgi:hypothetical protein